MSFTIKIEPEAKQDIQNTIIWYNQQQKGLGREFLIEVNLHFDILKDNPFFKVRYNNIHCLPLKKFPFMIHFSINESHKTVTIEAVFHTSLSPDKWKNRV